MNKEERYGEQKMPDIELRDLFAMHALSGLVVGDWGDLNSEDMANAAYLLADWMLEARKWKWEVNKNERSNK